MRKALVVLVLAGLSACNGGSGQGSSSAPVATPSPAPAATPASTPETTATQSPAAGATQPATEDQSDYYAATSCKIYGDIAARLRAGGNPDEGGAEAFAATGSAGNAADLNGGKWSDLKTALDQWVQALPEPAKRSKPEQAVDVQCAKVPASLRSAAAVLPSN